MAAELIPFTTVARVGEIAEGCAKAVRVGDKTIAIFRQGAEYYAIDDFCPHMGASLADGTVEGTVVTCPWHAWQFSLTDGTWVNSPRLKIACYTVRTQGEDIQVGSAE